MDDATRSAIKIALDAYRAAECTRAKHHVEIGRLIFARVFGGSEKRWQNSGAQRSKLRPIAHEHGVGWQWLRRAVVAHLYVARLRPLGFPAPETLTFEAIEDYAERCRDVPDEIVAPAAARGVGLSKKDRRSGIDRLREANGLRTWKSLQSEKRQAKADAGAEQAVCGYEARALPSRVTASDMALVRGLQGERSPEHRAAFLRELAQWCAEQAGGEFVVRTSNAA